MKKRIFCAVFAAICTLSLILPVAAEDTTADEKGVLEPPVLQNVGTAIVYNIENDRYIYELDADKIIPPASTVKLMTAIVAVEALGNDLSREVTVEAGAIVGVTGSNIALKRGEVLTVEQLLYALICGGANDAANVLAFEVAGSIEAFVALMNEKAQEIGAVNTVYTNPTGMDDPAMVTTTRDVAIIATYAYKTAPICEMGSVEKFVIPANNKAGQRTIFNKNYYFSTHMEYKYIWNIPRGLNAGYTPNGGSCVVTTGHRNGLTYVVAVMGASSDDDYIYSYTEAADLIKWAYNAYDYTKLLTTSDMVCEIPVKLSSRVDYVTLFPSENVELYLPTGLDLEKDINIEWTLDHDSFTAPVSEGEVGGKLTITYNGVNLGTYDLVTRNSVNRDNILYVLDLVSGFTETTAFKVIAVTVGVAVAGYIAVLIFIRTVRTKKQRRF
ncbi:MAG: D-alanyl-D-alanine carboxypeptidase [Clostridia bacterium]|nr:D-alanyl-D-alanine carboxypeptidase [Clostridia bacterium]